MTAAPAHVLVLGGQRSGKSRLAETLVTGSGRQPVYVATATAGDAEMAERIVLHRRRRDASWQLVEAPLALAGAIRERAGPSSAVLVDCLTLWLANLMSAEMDWESETGMLLGALAGATGPVVLVSNQVGEGVIPANPLARRYADALGTLNQRVAAAVPNVIAMTAGLPMVLKPASIPPIAL